MPFSYRWKHRGIDLRYILLGTIAFFIGPAFEFISIKGVRGGKQIVGLSSLVLLGYAIRGLWLQPEEFSVPVWLAALSWVLLAVAATLLIYSLCIEIPFGQTYHSEVDPFVKTTNRPK